jgi:uncharacterized protein with ParB-like and HNH nuclease domain
MQKSLEIFKAEPQSVFDILCVRNSIGFYLPAYQRPYSWEDTHIKDLFSDCENVFRNLLKSEDAIIFLGSILSVDDSNANTVYPLEKNHKPAHIKLIIDGQQRLTTLALIITCLNERLRILLPRLKKEFDTEQDENTRDALENLREIASQIILDTPNTMVETTAVDTVYKFLPKIIRSQVDCWGKDKDKANYTSPIAELLISYQKHIIELEGAILFNELNLGVLSRSSNLLSSNVKEIRKQLDYIQNGFQYKNSENEEEKLSIEKFRETPTLEQCLDFPVDQHLLSVSENNECISAIIYITAFAKFLLHRVCITYVEVNNESYAFDMFEALNTTGEPLTAIETFIPKVIEHIGKKQRDEIQSDLSADEAMLILTKIRDRFEKITKNKDKNDRTKELILAFVRAHQGSVKISSLRDQRDAMIKSYEQCMDIDKDKYLTQLDKTATFLFDHWQAPVPNVDNFVSNQDKDISNLCIRYLVDMKHDIVQPLLMQFILQDEYYATTRAENSSFAKILRAVTAFSVLWRAMSGTADGIDSVYKQLHEKGFTDKSENPEKFTVPPYKLKENILSADNFNVDSIKELFISELNKKIYKKGSPEEGFHNQWLDICSNQPLLKNSKSIKFLILSAFHGIKLCDGGFKRIEEPKTQFLTPTMWGIISRKESILQVFIPDNHPKDKGWTDDSIRHPDVFNKFGNILVDPRINSVSKPGQSWYNLKQNLLAALEHTDLKSIDNYFTNTELSEEAKRNASVLLLESKYDEITYADEWNEQVIDERTTLLLSNAWENLYAWLN